jgi:hypothetical protein
MNQARLSLDLGLRLGESKGKWEVEVGLEECGVIRNLISSNLFLI